MKESEKAKEDSRVKKTYSQLSEALRSLLPEKSFEDIFVTDICERAMIHRTTFYKHFKDKYHLLDFCVKELIYSFEEESRTDTAAENSKDYYMNLIRKALEYMMANKKLLLTGIFKSGSDSVLPMLYRSVGSLLELKRMKSKKQESRQTIPIPIMAQYYSGAFVSTSIWWLENDTPISVDEMVRYFNLLIREH